jgi:hypothetical protein
LVSFDIAYIMFLYVYEIVLVLFDAIYLLFAMGVGVHLWQLEILIYFLTIVVFLGLGLTPCWGMNRSTSSKWRLFQH